MNIKFSASGLAIHHLAWGALVAVSLAGCGGGGSGASASSQGTYATASVASVRVPVTNGTPPTTTEVGSVYQYIPSVSAPGGLPLSYTISNKPNWATFDTTTGELYGTPHAADVGITPNIEIVVSDGTSQASIGPFRIRITALPVVP